MRLQRALARAGVASRRKAEELILAGKVFVNGVQAVLGQSVNADADRIEVEGRVVRLSERHRWIVLHKPIGVITSAGDPRGRRTVFELLPEKVPGMTYVGRLDYMTEGILILTTDGEAAHALTHPSSEVPREYHVFVTGDAPAAVQQMRRGVTLTSGFVRPEKVVAAELPDGSWRIELTVREGRNRVVRTLCEATGLRILRLVRTAFGPVRLGALPPGGTRQLTAAEVRAIDQIVREARS